MADFTTVGKVDEIPEGELRAFDVNGEDVAVANADGGFHAFSNVCTHQQCGLADGDLEGIIVTCPCHGSQFDVTTGDVKNGPATMPVDKYEVQVEGDELRIGI